MKDLKKTLEDLNKTNIKFVLTRFDSELNKHDDLDILVKKKDFDKLIEKLEKNDYKSYSHDQALGGRVKGAQKNLTKKGRIKIDLHKDFTWRADRYLDLDVVWWNIKKKNISEHSLLIPERKINAFLVLINIIFEKTYITQEEHELLWGNLNKIRKDKDLNRQAEIYGWKNTYIKFSNWTREVGEIKDFPKFLPISLIIYSYLEKFNKKRKFHLISFLYYFYFRTRYLLNKQLPYD